MTKTILSLAKLLPFEEAELEQRYNVVQLYREKDPEAVLQKHKSDIQAIIGSPATPVRRHLIEALPALEIISQFAVGYDNIDLEAAREREIKVTNTPDVLTADTADIAVSLVLSVARRIVEGDVYTRVGQWLNAPMQLGTTLYGKTVGIVGLGRIGQAIAKRLSAFDMSIVYHGRSAKANMPYQFYDDVEVMAGMCDFLVLACSGGPETENMVNEAVLDALGADGFLINIARGSVVDEAALMAALKDKRIAGAGLDVYQNEPYIPVELREMDNVVLLPHIGSATKETRSIMGRIVLENLDAHFKGKPLTSEVI